jgi:hypothetical protein
VVTLYHRGVAMWVDLGDPPMCELHIATTAPLTLNPIYI